MSTGATGTTTHTNRECLFRLQALIIDGGTEVVRNLFDQSLPGVALNVFLSNEKKTIKILKKQKTITKVQYNLLYPPAGQLPNSSDFDITLIICLLRNLPSLGLNDKYAWNVSPQSTDLSIEADVCRLKGFRNEVAHISSTKEFQQSSFQTKWTYIEQVLLRLNSSVRKPLPNFNQTIEGYKCDPLDPVAEQRIKTIINQWKNMERGLETEVLLVKSDVSDTNKEVDNLKKDISDTKKHLTSLNNDVTDLKQKLCNVEQKRSATKQDIKNKVETLEADVCITKREVWNLEKEVSDTKQSVNILKKDRRHTNVVDSLKQDLQNIKQDVKKKEQDVSETKENIQDIKNHVSIIEQDMKSIKQEMPSQKGTEYAYVQLKANLQKDLIAFYLREHKRIPLSPLIKEDQPLLEFFVPPDLWSVKVTRSRDGDKEVKTPVRKLRDMFYQGKKLCSNIYLTADAGLGKTAFCKWLVLMWCHAMKPDKSEVRHFSDEDVTDMRGFNFVFFVLLRDNSIECDIDMLILNQICSQLSHSYDLEQLRNILCEETCLVILDGLDEWTHPLKACNQGHSDIPHQRAREYVAVLTTSRPWKLSVIGLYSSQIDQTLELTGLSDHQAKALKRSVISHLYVEQDMNKIDELEAAFNATVEEKHKDLTATPLFLMYFLFLWYYKYHIGKSLADLYSSITELVLSRSVKENRHQVQNVENIHSNIPPCFATYPICRQLYTLLRTLGELAFHTLFSKTKENTLVFDGCVANKYLSKEDLAFCFKTGIITQSTIQGASLLERKTKVSFAHKTIQEFLAALYVNFSPPEQKSIPEMVVSECKCVKDILDISKIIMFTVGLNAKSSLTLELLEIINEDKITREYRSSLQHKVFSHPLRDLQDIYVSCCNEIPDEEETNLCLQDVFIDERCQHEEYRDNLKHLTTRNKLNIISLYIYMPNMRDTPYNTVSKVVNYFALKDLKNIQKLNYRGEYNDAILPLLNSSVKCLSLSCYGLSTLPSPLYCSLFDKVTGLQKLDAIEVCGFIMSHNELTDLLDYISQRDCMREIELVDLDCTKQKQSSCTGLSLELSRHLSLRELTLDGLPLSQVVVNMASLEKCTLRLSYQELKLKFLNPKDNILNTLICNTFNSSVAIDEVLDAIRLSSRLEHIELWFINLETKTLPVSVLVNIQRVELWWVTIEASTLSELVDLVPKFHQTVTIVVRDCTISTRKDFELVKEKIKRSRHFKILENMDDEEDDDRVGRFEFETIKDSGKNQHNNFDA